MSYAEITRDQKYSAFVEDDVKNNKGRIINCCEELDYLLKHPEVNEIFNEHYLYETLTYATVSSPYYRKYRNYKNISDFPIVDKQFLKDHWDQIVIPEYQSLPDNREKYTSGSTGTPFKMLMDRYKHCRWIAGNKVFRANVGVMSHEKTLYFSSTVADKNIPMERQDKDNVYYINRKHLDDATLTEVLNILKKNNMRTLTAMASILEKMAHFIHDGKAPEWTGKLLAVFSVSEHLKENVRKVISDYFRCPVYVLYANEENGVLAVEDGTDYGCRANEVDFFFEVLSMDSDNPAREGELGRLVITDLFNKAFPVIRYENGDLVSWRRINGKLYFSQIAGRRIDTLYTTDGKPVHYFEGISFLEPYMDIRQFQLIQYDYDKFKWVLNTNNHNYEEMIIKESKAVFGDDSSWRFEYVDELPKLRSGKVQMTVCMIPNKREGGRQ